MFCPKVLLPRAICFLSSPGKRTARRSVFFWAEDPRANRLRHRVLLSKSMILMGRIISLRRPARLGRLYRISLANLSPSESLRCVSTNRRASVTVSGSRPMYDQKVKPARANISTVRHRSTLSCLVSVVFGFHGTWCSLKLNAATRLGLIGVCVEASATHGDDVLSLRRNNLPCFVSGGCGKNIEAMTT